MEDQEQQWVRQACAGDQTAFAQLVQVYQKPVYNLAYRMLGNDAEADDAAQETFIRMYTRMHTYDPERKFSSWVLAIASHYCIDMLRRRHVSYASIDDLPPMIELSMPHSEQPEQVMIQAQSSNKVQTLLDSLEPAYRVPVILRYWYDMSYKEIADAMDVTESTIKTRLHRARSKLACEVQDDCYDLAQPATL